MLSMQKEGAAHRNTRDIAVRCTFMGSFNSQSTNPSVAGQVFGCAAPVALKLFFLKFGSNTGGNLVKGEQGKTNLITLLIRQLN
jgi:hypothetical protein